MTILTDIHTVPRRLVSGYLRVTRLPITAVERIAKQQDNDRWPPALAYESFEATVETVVGSWLHDDVLVDKGEVRRAKVDQLRKATLLVSLAAKEQAEADEDYTARQREIAAQRDATARRAQQRKQELDRQAQVEAQRVKQRAAKRATASRQAKSARDAAITRQERTTKTGALKAQSRALSTAKRAVDADETVDVIDAAIRGSKAARKSR